MNKISSRLIDRNKSIENLNYILIMEKKNQDQCGVTNLSYSIFIRLVAKFLTFKCNKNLQASM